MMDCGGCIECCTALPIVELNKPIRVRCNHVCGNGCTVYADRPQSCRIYMCMWLQMPEVGPELRPDRCGVIFEKRNNKIFGLIVGCMNEYALIQFNEFKKQGFRVFWKKLNDGTELH